MFDNGYNSGLIIHFMVLLAQKVHPDPGGLSPFQTAKSAQYFKLALLNHSKNLGGLTRDDSLHWLSVGSEMGFRRQCWICSGEIFFCVSVVQYPPIFGRTVAPCDPNTLLLTWNKWYHLKFHSKGMVVIEAIHRTTKALPPSKANSWMTFKRCQNA